MVVCDILDFQCIFVSELIGSAAMTIIIAVIFYFIMASKLRWGFETTIALAVPILLVFGQLIMGFSALYAFITLIVGFFIATVLNELISSK